jgi:hypothetical protein
MENLKSKMTITDVSNYISKRIVEEKERGLQNSLEQKTPTQTSIWLHTTQEVAKEQIEPLIKSYAESLRKFIDDPSFTVNIQTGNTSGKK